MSHSHAHGHSHSHNHGAAAGRLGIAFFLNAAFTIVELVGAWFTNSTAIAADAMHDLGDTFSLAFAWAMQGVSKKNPTKAYTYGFRRLSLVGAFVNVVVLLAGGALVLVESVPRLANPETPDAMGMLGLAVLGVVVNGVAVLRVRSGTSLNERIVTWHLLEDVLGWVAVLIVSVVMLFADVPILDPLLSIVITSWVAFNALKNLRATTKLFLQAVPEDIDVEELKSAASAVTGVEELRHVHVWSMEGEHHVLTGDLLVSVTDLASAADLREQVRELLKEKGINHCTLELTPASGSYASVCGPADQQRSS